MWKVGLLGYEVEFKQTNQPGVVEEIKKFGRLKTEKRKFTVNFTHMDETQRNLLYAVYALGRVLKFHDNMGNVYNVYWGECARSMDGTAHQPDKPEFGIDRSNILSGALRWSGTAVFTEV